MFEVEAYATGTYTFKVVPHCLVRQSSMYDQVQGTFPDWRSPYEITRACFVLEDLKFSPIQGYFICAPLFHFTTECVLNCEAVERRNWIIEKQFRSVCRSSVAHVCHHDDTLQRFRVNSHWYVGNVFALSLSPHF